MRSGAPDLSSPAQVLPVAYAVPVTRDGSGNPVIGSSSDAIELNEYRVSQEMSTRMIPGRLGEGGSGFPIASGSLKFTTNAPSATSPAVLPWQPTTMPAVFTEGAEFAILERSTPLTTFESPMAGFIVAVVRAEKSSGALSHGSTSVEFAQLWADEAPIESWRWQYQVGESASTDPRLRQHTIGHELWGAARDGAGERGKPAVFADSMFDPADAEADLEARFPQAITSTVLPTDTTLAAQITQIVESVGGAAWPLINDGRWRTRSADELANGTPTETVEVLDKLEDLAWSTDAAFTYDAVVVAYQRLAWNKMAASSKDFEKIYGTHELPHAERVWLDHPIAGAPGYSVSTANTKRDGTGLAFTPDESATSLAMNVWDWSWGSAEKTSAWLVDAEGDPGGVIAPLWAGQLTDAESSFGDLSGRVLRLTVGQGIQDEFYAASLAHRLWTATRIPRWVAAGARVVVNLNRELGDTIRLTHPSGFDTRALVVGVEIVRTPGEIAQFLDVAILPPTFDDWNTAMVDVLGAGFTFDDYNTWAESYYGAGFTFDDFNTDPLAIGAP